MTYYVIVNSVNQVLAVYGYSLSKEADSKTKELQSQFGNEAIKLKLIEAKTKPRVLQIFKELE